MGDSSTIEWTDATWNPVTGCSKVSPGCAHCYAETLTRRFASTWHVPDLPWTPENAKQNVILHPERLDQPLRWKRPRMVFVNSMSDLFHEEVPAGFIGEVMSVIRRAPQHTFQVLTKRPERALEVLRDWWSTESRDWTEHGHDAPPRNLWLGVSIENRRYVGRADVLREIPVWTRFISAEPLLGPLVNAARHTTICECGQGDPPEHEICLDCGDDVPGCSCDLDLTGIDWLIVGGESGQGHRPMRDEWARDLRNACLATPAPESACDCLIPALEGMGNHSGSCGCLGQHSTAFFFKQWGGRTPKARGRLLDGRTWDEMPARVAVA